MNWWIWVVTVLLSACGSVNGNNTPKADAGTDTGNSPCVLDGAKLDNCKL